MTSAIPLVESQPSAQSKTYAKKVILLICAFAATVLASTFFVSPDGTSVVPESFNFFWWFANDSGTSNKATRIAFIGNSMMYYSDTPRFFSNLAQNENVEQDSCLRGGASLVTIIKKGNGMGEKFNTYNALKKDGTPDIGASDVITLLAQSWDFVVMNDWTQAPARPYFRNQTIEYLKIFYAPFMLRNNATPVLMMTPAYRAPVNSSDLGGVEEFTQLLYEGYQTYVNVLNTALAKNITKLAPVGMAYYNVYLQNQTLWEKLFYIDGKHPTVYGTFLQGCVLHWTIYGQAPPEVNDVGELWGDARRFYPPEANINVEFPSMEEMNYLRGIAESVCTKNGS